MATCNSPSTPRRPTGSSCRSKSSRAALGDASLRDWDGFGLAVQAYQKRALAVIDWVEEVAAASRRRLTVRLVKGAYWDTEIKRAQERGLADYPVFTRKAMTDLCYMACVKRLLAARDRLFPQFATHNALTVASVIEGAGGVEGFEFQRLYGMGEALYEALLAELPDAACRVYAPVGGHRDLLAYLVRRLLENGANSSFVSVAADPSVPIAEILRRPQSWIAGPQAARNSRIPLPRDIYRPERRGAAGVEFGDRASLDALRDEVRAGIGPPDIAAPLVDGIALPGRERPVVSPIDGKTIGAVHEADDAIAIAAMAAAAAGFPAWAATPVDERAAMLERAADRLEVNRGRLLALLQSEGGKTLDDALAELREAVDYCRYYARAGADRACAAADAGADRREQRVALSRPRRVRLHQPVEFSAGDLPRPGDCGAGRRQYRRRQAGRADAADRRACGCAAARGRRAGERAASRSRRRRRRCEPRRRSARRRGRLHRLDRSRPRHQPRACREKRRRSCR